jgi:hypothetical protein
MGSNKWLRVVSLATLISMVLNVPLALAANGEVLSEQKISDTAGSFTATLVDNDKFGWAVDNIGDLDNDGVTDLVVGAYADDTGGNARGAVYILFMDSDGTVDSHQKISDTDGDFTATFNDSDFFGISVAGIGDLDGDGIEDIAVGADGDDDEDSGSGAVYILFLGTDGKVDGYQKISDTEGDFTDTLDVDNFFGRSVTNIGDVDNDGITDIAVGAHNDNDGGSGHGAVFVLFLGTDGKVDGSQKISDTVGDFTASIGTNDYFGTSVVGIGDLDGDTIEDIAVGVNQDDDGGNGRGAVYVLFLGTDGAVDGYQKISDTDGDFTATFDDGDHFGRSVGYIGDLDNDGIGDIVVGAEGDDDGAGSRGAVYVLFMGTDGKVDSFQKISDTAGGLTTSLGNSDEFGSAVAGIGDIDGDGNEDIVVGVPEDDDGAVGRGAMFVLNLDGPAVSSNPFFPGWSMLVAFMVMFFVADRYKERFSVLNLA